jgi:hypothetical protein
LLRKTAEEDDQDSVEGAINKRKRKECTKEGCKKPARKDQMCQQRRKDPEKFVDNKDELDAFIWIGRGSGSNHKNENKGYLKLMICKRPEYEASTNKNIVAKAAKEEAK